MMRQFTAAEVQAHTSADSCWVILYGKVYDVTSFLPEHPGGSSIILRLAGKDATEQYDPVHPPGTLEENLPASACLGTVDTSTLPNPAEEQSKSAPADSDNLIAVSQLLNIDEIEAAATGRLSKKAWAYYYSASDDLYTKVANGRIYQDILLRPRIFVDCTRCSLTTKMLGYSVQSPVFVSPAAMARLGDPSGEAGIAEACAKFGACQIISQNASMTPEQIVNAASDDQVFGWQLYVQVDRSKSERMLARINALQPKIKFIVLTLDAPVPGKREDDERQSTVGAALPVSSATKQSNDAEKASKSAAVSGGIGKELFQGTAADLTWDSTLSWLRRHTDLPVVLKGIQTHEDAALAAKHAQRAGIAGIVLSNHGGRAADTAPPPILVLLEIRQYCPWVLDQLEIWVDGGIRRGTDVVKALCLGAKAVGLGRAALYGLAAGGPAGVERVFEILNAEIATAMRLLGVERVQDLGERHVNARLAAQRMFLPNTSSVTTGAVAAAAAVSKERWGGAKL